jgi:hypothetical protein
LGDDVAVVSLAQKEKQEDRADHHDRAENRAVNLSAEEDVRFGSSAAAFHAAEVVRAVEAVHHVAEVRAHHREVVELRAKNMASSGAFWMALRMLMRSVRSL